MEQLQWFPPEHFKAAALDTAIKNDIHGGAIIPDFRKNIQSKFLALIFWDVSCSHCKKAIQELWDVYQACKNKGLQVIAVQTLVSREGKVKWIDYINEQGMYDWFNAWIIYDIKWHELYIHGEGVPKVYLLNEKKEIILKGNFNIEVIQSIVDAEAAKN
jgi:alkyl hydroperoxide reductase subunit AhpC